MDGLTEFQAPCPEIAPCSDPATPDNEFAAIPPPERDDADTAARNARRNSRLKKNFLLQAAAAVLAVVIITSSMGVDIFGGGDLLDEVLDQVGAGRGVITVSMLWHTTDDVDLHVITPSGEEIFYSNPQAGGGYLDIDMQVSSFVKNPVENIYFETAERGTYQVFIVNYYDRNPGDSEVLVRVTVRGVTKDYRVVLDSHRKFICSFTY